MSDIVQKLYGFCRMLARGRGPAFDFEIEGAPRRGKGGTFDVILNTESTRMVL